MFTSTSTRSFITRAQRTLQRPHITTTTTTNICKPPPPFFHHHARPPHHRPYSQKVVRAKVTRKARKAEKIEAAAKFVARRTPEQLEFRRRKKEDKQGWRYPDLSPVFAKPTWSVRALLSPPSTSTSTSPPPSAQSTPSSLSPEEDDAQQSTRKTTTTEEITPQTLSHLLRLSALPQPTSPAEQASMLSTLHTQLRFVRDVQTVDTRGVAPLHLIHDETTKAVELMVHHRKQVLAAALEQEVEFGYHRRRRWLGRQAWASTPVNSEEGQGSATLAGEEEHEEDDKDDEEDGKDEATQGKEAVLANELGEEALVKKATKARRERGYFVVEGGKAKRGE